VALLKDAYRTELLEPSARTEEAISSLLSERTQLQAATQQLRQKVLLVCTNECLTVATR
jgi:hypothetical protein